MEALRCSPSYTGTDFSSLRSLHAVCEVDDHRAGAYLVQGFWWWEGFRVTGFGRALVFRLWGSKISPKPQTLNKNVLSDPQIGYPPSP